MDKKTELNTLLNKTLKEFKGVDDVFKDIKIISFKKVEIGLNTSEQTMLTLIGINESRLISTSTL